MSCLESGIKPVYHWKQKKSPYNKVVTQMCLYDWGQQGYQPGLHHWVQCISHDHLLQNQETWTYVSITNLRAVLSTICRVPSVTCIVLANRSHIVNSSLAPKSHSFTRFEGWHMMHKVTSCHLKQVKTTMIAQDIPISFSSIWTAKSMLSTTLYCHSMHDLYGKSTNCDQVLVSLNQMGQSSKVTSLSWTSQHLQANISHPVISKKGFQSQLWAIFIEIKDVLDTTHLSTIMNLSNKEEDGFQILAAS
jgi:hypothetical protein